MIEKFELRQLDMQTTDGTLFNLDALIQIAPSCFTEGMVRMETLSRGRFQQKPCSVRPPEIHGASATNPLLSQHNSERDITEK